MPQKLYVLTTDPRMPSKLNLWETLAAAGPDEASDRFKDKITRFCTPSQPSEILTNA